MGWVRLDDGFYDHGKVELAGPLGLALWVSGLAWCNRNLSDGFIPRGRARTLLDFEGLAFVRGMSGEDVTADLVIDSLLEAGLWERDDARLGFVVHDYLDYQPSADEVLGKRLLLSQARAEAGRRGGLLTQQKRKSSEANKATSEAKVKPQSQPQLKTKPLSPSATSVDAIEADFNNAWEHYPRTRDGTKPARKPALEKYRATRKRHVDAVELFTAVENYARCERVQNGYVMGGERFFGHNEEWREFLEVSEVNRSPNTVNGQEITFR